MKIGDKAWCINAHSRSELPHLKPWKGTFIPFTRDADIYGAAYYMRPDDHTLGDWISVRPATEVFKTEEEANAAYIKAETARINALEDLWQSAWKNLLTFKASAQPTKVGRKPGVPSRRDMYKILKKQSEELKGTPDARV